MTYNTEFDQSDNQIKTTFSCQHCRTPHIRPGELDETLNAVRNEIDFKVRNGEWEKAVRQPAANGSSTPYQKRTEVQR